MYKTKLTNRFLAVVKKSDLRVKITVNSMSRSQHTHFVFAFLPLLTGPSLFPSKPKSVW